jgi:hypothetical protein
MPFGYISNKVTVAPEIGAFVPSSLIEPLTTPASFEQLCH